MQIDVFGDFSVVGNDGAPVSGINPLGRALLGFLATHPEERSLGRRNAQWAAVLDAERNDVKRAVYTIRAALGSAFSKARQPPALQLDRVSLTYDMFLAGCADDATTEQRLAAWRIYCRGRVLQSFEGDRHADGWRRGVEGEVERSVIRLLDALADEAERERSLAAAAEWMRHRVAVRAHDERAVGKLMRLHLALGERTEAIALGRRFVAEAAELDLSATGQVHSELERIISGAAPPPARAFPIVSSVPVGRQVSLVGRSETLDAILGHITTCVDGRTISFIEAEAGSGKTRLCQELVTRFSDRVNADGPVALYGRFDGEREFSAFQDALGDFLLSRDGLAPLDDYVAPGPTRLLSVVPALADRAPGIKPLGSVDRGVERVETQGAVVELLRNIAARGPLLLVLDDLHRADESSLTLLTHCVAALSRSRVAIVCCYRDADDPAIAPYLRAIRTDHPDHVRTSTLERLTGTEVRLLAEQYRGASVSAEEAQELLRLSGGLPYLVEEKAGPIDDPALALRPETERVLAVCATLGTPVGLDLLSTSMQLNVDRIRLAVKDATQHGVLVSGDLGVTVTFTHALRLERYRASDALTSDERRAVSVRAVQWLRERPGYVRAARMARLCEQTGEFAEACGFYQQAAREAADRAAHEVAARYLSKALDLAGAEDEVRCELLLAYGDALWNCGRFRASSEAFAQAVDHHRTAEQLARAALGYAGRLGFQGVTGGTKLTTLLDDALARLSDEAEPSPLAIRLTACLAQALTFQDAGTRERGVALGREAVELASRRVDRDPEQLELLVDVHCRTCWTDWEPQNLAQRLETAESLVRRAELLGRRDRELEVRVFRTCCLIECGRFDEARREWERCRALAERLRQPYYDSLVGFIRAMFKLLEGPDVELPQVALEAGKRQEHPGVLQLYGAQILYVLRLQGRLGELLSASRDLNDCYRGFAPWKAGLALIYMEMGELTSARREVDALLETGVPKDMFWLICMDHVTRVLCALFDAGEGRADRLLELLDELAPYEDRYIAAGGAVALHSTVPFLQGLIYAALGDHVRASAALVTADGMARKASCRPAQAEAQLHLASVALEREDSDLRDAMHHLRRSLALCRECGILAFAQELADLAAITEDRALAAEDQDTLADSRRFRDEALRFAEQAPSRVGLPRRSFMTRAKSRFAASGARLVLGMEEDALAALIDRRQAALFRTMAAEYQAEQGLGFQGFVTFHLRKPDGRAISATLSVRSDKARHVPSPSSAPDLAVTIGVRDFVALMARQLNGTQGWLEGTISLEGDPVVAARLVEMFGGRAALAALE